MSSLSRSLTRSAVAGVLAMTTIAALGADALPLRRVLLSTGGVGYFEHEGVVDGDAELPLKVRLDQVDDVLKSLVVYDNAGGVGAVRLPGREPLEQVFRDLPFSREALQSPVALFNALQGAQVEVGGQRQLRGRILQVVPETVQLGEGLGTLIRHRFSLETGGGVQQFLLEEADAIRLVEPGLQQQLDAALAAIERHRVRDERTFTLTSRGQGRRTVRVGYVVGVPLWKATYRLTVGGGEGSEGGLQGWAVLENLSGRDWQDVELTLASGNPVTFRQALYAAYYVERPTVPVEVLGRILPEADTGTLREAEAPSRPSPMAAKSRAQGMLGGRAKVAAMDMAAEEAPMEAIAAAPAIAPAAAAPQALASSEEAATQVLFRFPEPVSVKAGESLLVPMVDRKLPAESLSLYQPQTHATHPLAAVRLVNDSGAGLPPGVLTLYQGPGPVAYVGDARLTTLPTGEARLLSFALDQKTLVSKEVKSTRHVARAAIERGVLRFTTVQRQTTRYRLKAPANEDRRLLIEQPRLLDWKLIKPEESQVELAQNLYRIRVDLGKGTEQELEVVTERPMTETVAVASLSLDGMRGYAQSTELEPPLRKAFARMAELQREVDAQQQQIDQLRKEHEDIVQDQGRIRENLQRLSSDSDLYRRYVKKLDGQETRLEALAAKLTSAQARLDEARRALADFIARLRV